MYAFLISLTNIIELSLWCVSTGDEVSGKVKAIGIHDIKAGETHVAVVLVSLSFHQHSLAETEPLNV